MNKLTESVDDGVDSLSIVSYMITLTNLLKLKQSYKVIMLNKIAIELFDAHDIARA